ncbi:ATP-binding protein [Vibrio sp. 03-59-1]|uniref:ATP-binding protein n=1 Tax=Vibrio sp. 03-59-1 TaxID=2607607 RepID=UPI001493D64F|nr:ATP-binding protein [Vibrio sp. 03-59-1]NOH85909.1 ATP-binding protein [Vibrio sp. 03-59-1]
MRPINPSNQLSNGHAWVCGMSGSGKTQLARRKLIKDTDQVAIFDPLGDYQGQLAGRVVRSYTTLKSFGAALLHGRKTKQGFKIAYAPTHETTDKDFDKFCRVVWAAGNGLHTKPLKTICEEVAEHTNTSGKETGYYGKLLRLGRKYGIHTISLFQRGQEVSKTIIDNCDLAYVMMQKTPKSARYLEELTGIEAQAISGLTVVDRVSCDYIEQRKKGWKKGIMRF